MTWQRITCHEREALIDRLGRSYGGFSDESGIGVHSSLTDLDGQFGRPYVMTTWGYRDSEVPVLKDERWPDDTDRPLASDARPCEHHQWTDDGDGDEA